MNIAPHIVHAIATYKEEGDCPFVQWVTKILEFAGIELQEAEVSSVLGQIADKYTLRGAHWLAVGPKRSEWLGDLKNRCESGELKVNLTGEVVWDFA